MDSQVYAISEAFIKKTKRTYLCMFIFIPIGILLMATLIFFTDGDIQDISLWIVIFTVITLLAELEIIIISKVMLKKVKENTLTIGPDFLQRTGKKTESPLYFKHIQKLYIKKEATNNIAYIDVRTDAQTIRLCGFENLEDIKNLLIVNAPQASIKESQYKLDYNHPTIFALTFFVALIIFFFFKYQLSIPLNDIFSMGFGVWILFFKPISKAQGQRFRLVELICGLIIVLSFGIQYLSLLLG